MKILVLGATGMLGHKLVQTLSKEHEVVGTTRGGETPVALTGHKLICGVRAEDFSSVIRSFSVLQPEAVINCIGLIKQLKPSRRDQVALNALFPHQVSELCQASGARFVHLSTDCVFSGEKGSYTECSTADPLDDYGMTKLLGEVQSGALTLRTSIVGREISGGYGLVEWFYSQRGQTTKGFRRAIYSGLTTLEISRVIANVLENHKELEGVWHVSSDPINKFDLLEKINRLACLGVTLQAQDEFVCDRSLDSSKFREKTGYVPPTWDDMIEEMVRDGKDYEFTR